MTSNYSDFRPVVPNIVDDTMKEDDRFAPEDTNTDYNKSEPNIEKEKDDKNYNEDSSTGRKIMIGILIVIIVILVILLVYQVASLYKVKAIL